MSENMINVTGKVYYAKAGWEDIKRTKQNSKDKKGKKREKRSETPKQKAAQQLCSPTHPPLIPRKPP